ncbi:hypothetical protein BV898_18467 [Hypsibius exemplaris]|uniref:Uncharacterized protein n=1 Tax=Hypsibius exemplaris TaxID=2072580 RepID=A0A9X6NGZ7_HYPEX|nr:hypothetical protein BV898_18467 [Hypsibius exemplaris]
MPSDNETESGSSGNGGPRAQQQQQRSAPSGTNLVGATTQGGVTVKTIADAVFTQQSQWQLGDQSRCRNWEQGHRRNWDVSSDATKWQDMPKMDDEDLLAMLPLSLRKIVEQNTGMYEPAFQGHGLN